MLQEFSISRCTRRCHVGQRDLKPGEVYFSVIIPKQRDLVREDICASNWNGPPADAIGWWRSRMPMAGHRKLKPAPVGVLLETLTDLIVRPGKEPLAYMLALLLVRRRVIVEELSSESGNENQEPTSWRLTHPTDGREWMVTIALPPQETIEALQTELANLLFTEE